MNYNYHTLLLENIPHLVDESQFNNEINKFGETEEINWLRDSQGRNKGSCRVTYKDPKDAENAFQYFNQKELFGKSIQVDFCKEEHNSNCNEKIDQLEKEFREFKTESKHFFSSILNKLDELFSGNSQKENILSHSNESAPKEDFSSFSSFPMNSRNLYQSSYHSSFHNVEDANKSIWNETCNIIQNGMYSVNRRNQEIQEKVEESVKSTFTVDSRYNFDNYIHDKRRRFGETEKCMILSKIQVTQEGTFEAARRVIAEGITKVCALNFASAVKPGGGVINGRAAQEETISRQSSLYFSLVTQSKFYENHKKHNDPMYTDSMIYSPNVVVFRDENYNLIPYFLVSVISSAAVNKSEIKKKYRRGEKDNYIYSVMKNRIRKIIQLSLNQQNKAIILGAFGCGVFGNDPEEISTIFKEILVDEFWGLEFERIVFAVKSKPGSRNPNYEAFKSTFQ